MKQLYILSLFAIAALFIACEKSEEIDLDNYVINSFISEKTPFLIQATKTVSVFDTATYKSELNLQGKLFEDGKEIGNLVYQKAFTREGLPGSVPEGYSLPGFVPQSGKEYRFELKKGNDIIISGRDFIPKLVPFTIASTSSVKDSYDQSIGGLECVLKFKDPAETNNFYIITYNVTDFLEADDKIGWTQQGGWMKSDDPAIEKNYYHQGLLYTGSRFIFSDKYFDGKEYSLPVQFFMGHNSGSRKDLNIYLLSISEQYYKYITSLIKQTENNDDYYAEPTQVYNNIENGFGVFAGFRESKQVLSFGK